MANKNYAAFQKELMKDTKTVDNINGMALRGSAVTFFEEGDTFTIPTELVFVPGEFNGRPTAYLPVECEDGQVKNLFLTTFTKSVREYDSTNKPTGRRIKAQGTVTDFAQDYVGHENGQQELAEALKGKTIRVDHVEYVNTKQGDTYRATGIITANFVD